MSAASGGTREHQLWALFDACLELDEEGRARVLAQEVDPSLVREVGRLLLADAAPLEMTGAAGQALARLVAPAPTIDGFTILKQLGAGGFGVVYLAMQHTPSRRVALKVLHPVADDARSAERFRLEADALALLAHPHVPRVFAAGETAGRRWLAMEFVRGEPLDTWSAARPLRERLEALEAVARAIHVAHLRGLVHRDLKPDNVLVTRDGSPRVLDFGIAQSVGEAAPAAGTRAYMSPEQQRGAPVDGRADVYALGVMLRELALLQPHAKPPATRPERSTALALATPSSEDSRPELPRPSPGPLAPELESVITCATAALEQRYASAEAFAEDLRRFLTRARVLAHPPTWAYRVRCGLRQHRGLALGLSVLVAGLSVTALVFRAQVHTAELERARADATRDFLRATLVQANPLSGSGPGVTVGQAVDAAARRLDARALESSPEVEIDLRETLASVYASLGREVDAWQQSKHALRAVGRLRSPDGELEARLLRAGADYGAHSGALDTALEWLRRASALEGHHRAPHPHLAEQAHILGEVLMDAGRLTEAVVALGDAIAQREVLHRQGAVDAESYTSALNQQGHALCAAGRFDQARARYGLALEIDSREQADSPLELATDLHNLAWLALKEGRFEEALARSAQARALRLEKLGPRHLRLGLLRLIDGEALASLGRCSEALPFVEEGASILEGAVGAQSPRALRATTSVAQAELLCGRVRLEALPPVVAQLSARMGPKHWWVLEAQLTEARALIAAGQPDQGHALAARLAPALEAQLGPDAPLARLARSTAQGD